MASTYQAFLAAPTTSALASNASITYTTTTTTINEPTAILKHLQAQQKQVVKKDEKVLSALESASGVCLETATTLQFRNGGGAYLPGMDENLLDERIVVFPLVHIVNFDAQGKIAAIRLYWEQGTLLKQVEAIGKTGRNWPIREGQNLVQAVKDSVASAGASGGSNGSAAASTSRPRGPTDVVINQHKRGESVSATRDPHASLDLFAARDPNENQPQVFDGPKIAPRPSAKPAPRDMNELFAGEESLGHHHRSSSPTKIDGRSVKAGASKKLTENRLFDDNDHSRSPERRKKTFNEKYEHFDFGDGEDAHKDPRPPSGKRASRAQNSHFSFEDFHTPPKVNEKFRPDSERHWGAGVDEDDPEFSVRRPIQHLPRKDADQHFKMSDTSPGVGPNPPLSTITNVDASRRGQDFAAHHKFSNSPQHPNDRNHNVENDPPTRPRGDMDQHWEYSESPIQKSNKIYKTAGDGMGARKGGEERTIAENEKKIYRTAGDGMGGRKGSGRLWGFGDDEEPQMDFTDVDVRPSARSRRTQAQSGAQD